MNPSVPHISESHVAGPHISEDDMILYQLHNSPDAAAIRAHLETCSACAELAASITETLRVFSAAPVPQPDLDRAWSTLRPQLHPFAPTRLTPSARLLRIAPATTLALAAILLLTFFLTRHQAPSHPQTIAASLRPGPLTTHPVNPDLANHLDSAERFLTEVSHTSTPLDPALREQAQTLLASNALCVQTARNSGDLADAAVLENLGRLLTAADHESPTDTSNGWHIRFELNANGLLLDLRILRQNQFQHSINQPTSTQENLQ